MFQFKEVITKSDVKDFHRVPFIIYKNDPNWIPHLMQDIDAVFDPSRNKFFKHGEVVRWVLKNEQGELIGRVAAFVNRKLSDTFKQPTGGMGFFECIENKEAAFALFAQCREWLEARGMKAMDGPINFGEKDKFWGLLVENFTAPNTYGMNYNPSYYKTYFEAYGFKTYYEQYVVRRPVVNAQQKFADKSAAIFANPDYHFETISRKNLPKYAEDFRIIYNDAWGGHNNFKPMTKEQSQNIMAKLKPVMDEDIMYFGYYKKEPIAFYISIPELNEIFKYVNGNLNWWGKIKFLYYKWKGVVRTMYSIVFGVIRSQQGKGVEGAIIKFAEKVIVPQHKYDYVILTWIGDFNPKMLKVADNLEATRFRTYITYRKMLDETIPFERAPIIGE